MTNSLCLIEESGRGERQREAEAMQSSSMITLKEISPLFIWRNSASDIPLFLEPSVELQAPNKSKNVI